jgi:hypothetical protein
LTGYDDAIEQSRRRNEISLACADWLRLGAVKLDLA